MLRRVERRAQLAARPWPRLWISARFRVILAQGVAASMSMQPLKTGSRGSGSTSRKQKSGKAISLQAEMSQTIGEVNSFLKSSVARRIPRMIMHSGVDMFPTVRIPSCSMTGSQVFAFSSQRMKPTAAEITEGLSRAARRDMCFFSPVRVKTQTVQATMFSEILNIQE